MRLKKCSFHLLRTLPSIYINTKDHPRLKGKKIQD